MVFVSIKPIDFQVSVPRTLEASKVNSDQIQKNMSSQQLQAIQTRIKSEQKSRLIQKSDNLDKLAIRERQENARKKREGQKERKGGNYSRNSKDITPASTIDIRL